MHAKRNIEDCDDGTGKLDEIRCEDRTKRDSSEQAAVEESKCDVAPLWRRAVRCVGIRDSHARYERAAESFEEEPKQKIWTRKRVRICRCGDRDELSHKHACAAIRQNALSPISVAERAKFRRDYG